MGTPKVVKQVRGLRLTLGGEEHRGWLPPGAASPPPTPARLDVVDVRIEDDGYGYLLICESRNTGNSWDTWHTTLQEAEEAAEQALGIGPSDWHSKPSTEGEGSPR